MGNNRKGMLWTGDERRRAHAWRPPPCSSALVVRSPPRQVAFVVPAAVSVREEGGALGGWAPGPPMIDKLTDKLKIFSCENFQPVSGRGVDFAKKQIDPERTRCKFIQKT